ncbi:alpha-1,2-mannosyltransferase ALG9 isoform X2 [Malaya genurostris]|uniref:alpha-1,2-mannosyltransferase ALG9 isoform X2 n=1 Tax=Malaya genurostris TaxID=325434 RepID=UPI0026F3F69B|nr:alpha-1,2-mannosyltransferase ALG9 isoform X2 [Malaya genurostris]
MYIASTALLPSSFSMYLNALFLSAWWLRKTKKAIMCVVLSTFLGWPFTALISLPFLYDMLIRRRMYESFLFSSGYFTVIIGLPLVLVDSYFYGKFTLAPLNIIAYNIFSSHGPNLFGVESKYFYFNNLFLNFNVVWGFALIYPFIQITIKTLKYFKLYGNHLEQDRFWKITPLYIWLLVFMLQPHKEERFLFPVYPLLSLGAAMCITTIEKIFTFRKHSTCNAATLFNTIITKVILVAFILLSLSRIVALYRYYHAPMDLTSQLAFSSEEQNLCLGKDWHRFPGSFFLPSNFRIRFIKSSFTGLLPAYYDETNGGSKKIHSYFNNFNHANNYMLFDISKCDYLIDLDLETTYLSNEAEPNYSKNKQSWEIIKSIHFLDVNSSSKFYRSFYIPIKLSGNVQLANMNLLKRITK